MSGKLVFLVGVLGVGGYAGHKMMNFDPTVFALSKQQVETMLVDAKTTLPRRDGDGQIKIWSVGRSSKGVSLQMRYSDTAPLLTCQAVITELAADKTQVVPDCSTGSTTGSAIAHTHNALRVPMFEEHIQATLNQRPFDRDIVTAKETATVFKNMGGMQREALQQSDEMQRMTAQSEN